MGMEQWLWYSVSRKALDRDLEAVRHHMRGRVLEVGAGAARRRGYFCPPYQETSSWVALDINASCGPHVAADIQALPFPDASFDTVICLEVLGYVPEPLQGVRECRRVLQPEGRIILATPFFHRMDAEADFWRFTRSGLHRLATQAGFVVESTFTQGYGLGVVVNVLKRGIYNMQRGALRTCLAWLTWPVLKTLWALDEPVARQHPVLASYATGYMIVACVDRGAQ